MEEKMYSESTMADVNVSATETVDVNATVKRQRKTFSKVGMGFFIMTVVIMVFQMTVIGVVSYLWPDFYAEYTNVIGLLPISIIGFPAYFIMNKIFESAPAIEQKHKFTGKHLFLFILISFGVMWVGNLVATLINMGVAAAANKEATTVVSTLLSNSALWQNLIMVAIIAPILEEFLFRKLIIDKLSRFGEGVAILVSAVMFGLYHGNIVQLIYAAMLGLVLGYVYSKTRKIHYTIIIHMLINFFSGVFGSWVISVTNYGEIQSKIVELQAAGDMTAVGEYTMAHMGQMVGYIGYVGLMGTVNIAGLVLFIVTLVRYIKRGQMLLPGVEKLVKGKKFATVALNVGMILFAVAWIGMTIFSLIGSYFI
ncbi:MAG: CPBP family intramembrane metalloprotease [Lachnospiraceae bacterium]|nr:CPBP family intramembrane metalloprotease [Lachnospiraceae bacterium]